MGWELHWGAEPPILFLLPPCGDSIDHLVYSNYPPDYLADFRQDSHIGNSTLPCIERNIDLVRSQQSPIVRRTFLAIDPLHARHYALWYLCPGLHVDNDIPPVFSCHDYKRRPNNQRTSPQRLSIWS